MQYSCMQCASPLTGLWRHVLSLGLHICWRSNASPPESRVKPSASHHTPRRIFLTEQSSGFVLPWWRIRLHKKEASLNAHASQLVRQVRIFPATTAEIVTTDASGLVWWQPDRLCVHLKTDPCCWHMCGTGHPLCRYVYVSVPFYIPWKPCSEGSRGHVW